MKSKFSPNGFLNARETKTHIFPEKNACKINISNCRKLIWNCWQIQVWRQTFLWQSPRKSKARPPVQKKKSSLLFLPPTIKEPSVSDNSSFSRKRKEEEKKRERDPDPTINRLLRCCPKQRRRKEQWPRLTWDANPKCFPCLLGFCTKNDLRCIKGFL